MKPVALRGSSMLRMTMTVKQTVVTAQSVEEPISFPPFARTETGSSRPTKTRIGFMNVFKYSYRKR